MRGVRYEACPVRGCPDHGPWAETAVCNAAKAAWSGIAPVDVIRTPSSAAVSTCSVGWPRWAAAPTMW